MNRIPAIIKRIFRDRRGFSLVELLLAVILLVVVLMTGYTLYYFGTTSFEIGERQSDLQQNARLASDFIVREIRFAENMQILEENFSLAEDYYFIYGEAGAINHKPRYETEPYPILEDISGNIEFNIIFEVSANSSNTLLVNVEARRGPDAYSLETEVLLLNLRAITGNQGGSIRYQIPAPPDPVVSSIYLHPDSHVENKTENHHVTVDIITRYLDEGVAATVTAYFYHADIIFEDGNFSATPVAATVSDNSAVIELVLDKDLAAGDYHVLVSLQVEGYSDKFSLGRNYVIEPPPPSIDSVTVQKLSGQPHYNVQIQTIGVPSGEAAIVTECIDQFGGSLIDLDKPSPYANINDDGFALIELHLTPGQEGEYKKIVISIGELITGYVHETHI